MIDLHGPWSAIRRSPMLRMATPFMAGLIAGWVLRPTQLQAGIPFLVLTPITLVVLLLRMGVVGRWKTGLVIACWFLSFGFFWYTVRSPEHDPLYAGGSAVLEGPWAVRIEAINGVSGKVVRADAQLVVQAVNGSFETTHGKVMITFMRDSLTADPRVGDRLWMDATLEPVVRVADPGGFDRRTWASSRGVALEAFAGKGRWRVVDHPWQWTDAFTDLRERISKWLDGSGVPFRERALVKALVLGQRDELEYEQKNAFMRSGTIHVLAVSGMHVGLIFAVLSVAMGWWGRSGPARWVRGVLILLALWGYAGLTGASPSVLRATVMFSLFTFANIARQRTDHLNSLFAAALVLLVWDPSMLRQASFQLSFLAVLGIILLYRPLRALWLPGNWWLHQAWSLAVVSIAAQLLTTPLSLYLFKAFPVWFLPANIIVVTASTFAVYGGVLLILLYKLPVIGVAITWAMTLLLRIVGWSTDLFAALPGAYPAVRAGLVETLLMYLLVLALSAWWQWRWRSMRWLSAASFAALLVCWGIIAERTQRRSTFVVYDEHEGFVAGMVNARELVVASSSDSLLASARVATKLDRHQRAVGITKVVPVGTDVLKDALLQKGSTLLAQGRWRSPDFDVCFSNGNIPRPLSTGGLFDAMVLFDLQFLPENEIEALAGHARHLVLAGGIPWRVRNHLRAWCEEHQVACHDMRDRGAFILER